MSRLVTIILFACLAASNCVDKPSGAIEQVTLERTTCYGWCAAYSLKISGSGLVTYDGLHYVKVKGTRTKQLSSSSMSELRKEIDRVNYFNLRSSYASVADGCPAVWTDNPAANTSVTIGGVTKAVHHYLGCREQAGSDGIGETYPRVLNAFENAIDRIIGTSEWIGTEPERARNR